MVCQNCGRKLKDTISIGRGYGPVCWKQIHKSSHYISDKRSPNFGIMKGSLDVVPGQMRFKDYPEFNM